MNFNVYLPDEIGRRAKADDVNLSRMLRNALTAEFKRRDAMAEALSDTQTYDFDWKNEQLGEYTARVTGRQIWPDHAVGPADHLAVYVTSDKRVLLAYPAEHDWTDITPGQDLLQELNNACVPDLVDDVRDFTEICRRLGVRPVIDL